ncbi:MAG TPA: hypothetical protein VFC57_07655 [Aeromicrobium sp.]|nr:hypothetical protein [Aeromicrobium sp.]
MSNNWQYTPEADMNALKHSALAVISLIGAVFVGGAAAVPATSADPIGTTAAPTSASSFNENLEAALSTMPYGNGGIDHTYIRDGHVVHISVLTDEARANVEKRLPDLRRLVPQAVFIVEISSTTAII